MPFENIEVVKKAQQHDRKMALLKSISLKCCGGFYNTIPTGGYKITCSNCGRTLLDLDTDTIFRSLWERN
ncbi:MAG: hypothetical protein ACETWD_01215 [Desulfatiglandales bacterium]